MKIPFCMQITPADSLGPVPGYGHIYLPDTLVLASNPSAFKAALQSLPVGSVYFESDGGRRYTPSREIIREAIKAAAHYIRNHGRRVDTGSDFEEYEVDGVIFEIENHSLDAEGEPETCRVVGVREVTI